MPYVDLSSTLFYQECFDPASVLQFMVGGTTPTLVFLLPLTNGLSKDSFQITNMTLILVFASDFFLVEVVTVPSGAVAL